MLRKRRTLLRSISASMALRAKWKSCATQSSTVFKPVRKWFYRQVVSMMHTSRNGIVSIRRCRFAAWPVEMAFFTRKYHLINLSYTQIRKQQFKHIKVVMALLMYNRTSPFPRNELTLMCFSTD